jgi:hypothetical protein
MKNRHHRRAKSQGGGNGRIQGIPNVVKVEKKLHDAFHFLFPNPHPSAVADALNSVWIDPAYKLVVVPRN